MFISDLKLKRSATDVETRNENELSNVPNNLIEFVFASNRFILAGKCA